MFWFSLTFFACYSSFSWLKLWRQPGRSPISSLPRLSLHFILDYFTHCHAYIASISPYFFFFNLQSRSLTHSCVYFMPPYFSQEYLPNISKITLILFISSSSWSTPMILYDARVHSCLILNPLTIYHCAYCHYPFYL